ncbi:Peptidase family M28 [Cnuella takakiae]|uniref:Peptidase family M28 n=1 Tax=Cnuella takakiae TaxID=1302690 RepID=A0A1M5DX99_9BACT|nr:M28 family peptidase [Cnuella takakiae]OLY93839.1 peptidase M28 [Cnuella takakiae]SHF71565.1 Peptidase family M28 [Cnuella takakiae]
MNKTLTQLLLAAACTTSFAQQTPPGLSAIRTAELKKDLYGMADARFKGRSAGTVDELKAAAWTADLYRSIGLKPAGDDGTYFQYFDMVRNEVSPQSGIRINGKNYALWQEAAVAQMANASLDAPITYLGNALNVDTSNADVKGKVVAIEANGKDINLDVSLPTWRYSRYIYQKYGAPLVRRGAAAILFIADDYAEKAWADAAENFKRGSFDIEGGPAANVTTTVPVIWLHQAAKNELTSGNARLQANIILQQYRYPSANIVGIIPGSDPVLKNEYLLYSGHTDAHGIRNIIKGDSIYYGADDNASVNVAMLACARAFMQSKPKRSVIFVIHGAEERGLLGSRYFVSKPTVPLDKIVTVLNGDMIGRKHPDSAAILGSQVPHRTSLELVNMAMAANNEGPRFKLDTLWDKPTHVEGWYFRSDHLPYARLGIPSLMYTTLLHPDYHTPQDDAARIDYDKLKKMTDWMYRTGYKVANAAKAPARDKDFKLER